MKLRAAHALLGLAGIAGLATGHFLGELILWCRMRQLKRLREREKREKRFGPVAALLDKRAPRARRRQTGECTICLESIRARQWTRVTQCKSIFHSECLERWVFYSAERYMRGVPNAEPPICPNCALDLEVVPPRIAPVARTEPEIEPTEGEGAWVLPSLINSFPHCPPFSGVVRYVGVPIIMHAAATGSGQFSAPYP